MYGYHHVNILVKPFTDLSDVIASRHVQVTLSLHTCRLTLYDKGVRSVVSPPPPPPPSVPSSVSAQGADSPRRGPLARFFVWWRSHRRRKAAEAKVREKPITTAMGRVVVNRTALTAKVWVI